MKGNICLRHPCLLMFVSINSNTTDVACRAGTANTSWAPEFTPAFSGVRVGRPLVFCLGFCGSLFDLLSFFLFAVVLSVLWFTAFDALWYLQEEFENTKGVIRICKSRKAENTMVKRKRTNNNLVLELFRQWGIFCFRIVQTMRYILF